MKVKGSIAIIVTMGLLVAAFVLKGTVSQAGKEEVFIPVLMYHHFVEEGEETGYTTVREKAFAEQMAYLKSQGYITVTDEDLVAHYYEDKALPEKPIHVTMDDGYESNYNIAYPILKENDMKATIFVIASRIEDGEDYNISRATWEQFREMSDEGVMSIQSHTYDMHHKENVQEKEVSAVLADESESHYRKMLYDFGKSKQLIDRHIGKQALSLSFPFGHYNEMAISAAEAGYKLAYTIDPGLNSVDTNVFELHRINVPAGWSGKSIVKEIEKQRLKYEKNRYTTH